MRFYIFLFLLISFQSYGEINRERFYRVFEANSITKINEEISALNKEKTSALKDAFLGAMIMKRAQFLKTPKEKVITFKKGKGLLESAIKSHPNNAEFRFLRLAIQENCPKVLKYDSDINVDSDMIYAKFSSMNSIARVHVKKYAIHSKILKF